jgi:GlpG protein
VEWPVATYNLVPKAMRHLATLPSETAQTFADYLLTLKIQTRLEPETGGMAVWICDEDQVPRAREELVEFNRNPTDARYQRARPAADALRRQESVLEEGYRKRQARFQQKMLGLSSMYQPVTMILLVASVAVTLATQFGKLDDPLAQSLYFSSFRIVDDEMRWGFLFEIRSGQVWRLVTPIFIHLGVIHLLFNMLMLVSLGGAVEVRRGSLRTILLVLVLAVGSNLAQYYLGHPLFVNGELILRKSPYFGGMSGVLYGLFGYAWMKSRFEPHLGLFMPRETVTTMIVWFFLCLFGIIGGVANGAHAGGLVLGMLIGYAPTIWYKLRRRD